jgi:hypothetical protein
VRVIQTEYKLRVGVPSKRRILPQLDSGSLISLARNATIVCNSDIVHRLDALSTYAKLPASKRFVRAALAGVQRAQQKIAFDISVHLKRTPPMTFSSLHITSVKTLFTSVL